MPVGRVGLDGAVGFISVGRALTTQNNVKVTHLWFYSSLFPSCRKYLRNKLAFGQQLLPENHKCKGELRPRQAVLQVQRSFAGFSHHPEKGGVCSEGAAEDAVFGERFSFMSSE